MSSEREGIDCDESSQEMLKKPGFGLETHRIERRKRDNRRRESSTEQSQW